MNPLKIANTMANAAHKKAQKKPKPAEGSPEEEATESPLKEAAEDKPPGKTFPPKKGK